MMLGLSYTLKRGFRSNLLFFGDFGDFGLDRLVDFGDVGESCKFLLNPMFRAKLAIFSP